MKGLLLLIVAAGFISLSPSCQKETITETVVETDTVTIDLKRGLIAYYPFTGNTNDSSGNNKHGQPMNGLAYGTDVHNNANAAASFDGVDDYITIADANNYFAPSKMSVSFLLNLNNPNARSMIFNKGSFATPSGVVWGSGILPSGRITMTVADPTVACGANWIDNPSDDLPSTLALQANTWTHVTLIYNMGVELIYLNGVLSSAKVDDYTYLKQCATSNLKIGGWWQADVVSLHGKIDEVRIYNRILAENEIEKLAEERL